MLRVAVLASGSGTNLQAVINAIDSGRLKNTQIVTVISNNEDAYALERARKHKIEACCLTPSKYPDRELFHQALQAKLESYQLDLIVLAGYLVTLAPELIKRYQKQIINIHPSLIPSFCGVGYYGLKIHQKALERGVKITGATVHYVDEGVDTGEILLQQAVAVEAGDSPEILQQRVLKEAEWKLLPQAIEMIADRQPEIPHSECGSAKEVR